MGKRFVFNNGDTAKFVGGVMIPAGDGRDVDEMFLEPEEPAQELPPNSGGPEGGGTDEEAARVKALENLREVLAGSVKNVSTQLPDFSEETLGQLAELEAEGANRSSLLTAIAAEKLKRAQARAGGEPT